MQSPIDPFTPAVELAAAIRRKEVSPVEVADCYLERMDKLDPRLNAFCHRADDVRNAASAAVDAVVRAASAEDLPPFVACYAATSTGIRTCLLRADCTPGGWQR
jgi:amidase